MTAAVVAVVAAAVESEPGRVRPGVSVLLGRGVEVPAVMMGR